MSTETPGERERNLAAVGTTNARAAVAWQFVIAGHPEPEAAARNIEALIRSILAEPAGEPSL